MTTNCRPLYSPPHDFLWLLCLLIRFVFTCRIWSFFLRKKKGLFLPSFRFRLVAGHRHLSPTILIIPSLLPDSKKPRKKEEQKQSIIPIISPHLFQLFCRTRSQWWQCNNHHFLLLYSASNNVELKSPNQIGIPGLTFHLNLPWITCL